MMVERKWPMCIGLAMFGEEYSTMTVLPFPSLLEPYLLFKLILANCSCKNSGFRKKFKKPFGATWMSASGKDSCPFNVSATSFGFFFSCLASTNGKFVE